MEIPHLKNIVIQNANVSKTIFQKVMNEMTLPILLDLF